jgi:hypothetical protein
MPRGGSLGAAEAWQVKRQHVPQLGQCGDGLEPVLPAAAHAVHKHEGPLAALSGVDEPHPAAGDEGAPLERRPVVAAAAGLGRLAVVTVGRDAADHRAASRSVSGENARPGRPRYARRNAPGKPARPACALTPLSTPEARGATRYRRARI